MQEDDHLRAFKIYKYLEKGYKGWDFCLFHQFFFFLLQMPLNESQYSYIVVIVFFFFLFKMLYFLTEQNPITST